MRRSSFYLFVSSVVLGLLISVASAERPRGGPGAGSGGPGAGQGAPPPGAGQNGPGGVNPQNNPPPQAGQNGAPNPNNAGGQGAQNGPPPGGAGAQNGDTDRPPCQIISQKVEDQLNLTATQKTQIARLQKEVDARMAKILSADQKLQLQSIVKQ